MYSAVHRATGINVAVKEVNISRHMMQQPRVGAPPRRARAHPRLKLGGAAAASEVSAAGIERVGAWCGAQMKPEDFEEECKLHATLHHPNIVQMITYAPHPRQHAHRKRAAWRAGGPGRVMRRDDRRYYKHKGEKLFIVQEKVRRPAQARGFGAGLARATAACPHECRKTPAELRRRLPALRPHAPFHASTPPRVSD